MAGMPHSGYPPLTSLAPWYPGQMGVPGSDSQRGMRYQSTGVILYVDTNHPDASDAHDGTDPEHPKATIQGAVNARLGGAPLPAGSIIRVAAGQYVESVVTPNYLVGPNYITIEGVGSGIYSPAWESAAATTPCLDLRAVGWRIRGFRFYAPTQASCIELRHTDSGANDIAIRTVIENNLFDGMTTGRYGIVSHGCYDVWIQNNVFQLFHNAVAGGAVPLFVGATPLAIPYRNHIIGNWFWDSDNGAIFPCNGSEFHGNLFQPVGYAYTMTQVLNTSTIGNPGDDNVVFGNVLLGDYSIVGGYNPGAADSWLGNWAEDVAEAEVGDNGITIARPT